MSKRKGRSKTSELLNFNPQKPNFDQKSKLRELSKKKIPQVESEILTFGYSDEFIESFWKDQIQLTPTETINKALLDSLPTTISKIQKNKISDLITISEECFYFGCLKLLEKGKSLNRLKTKSNDLRKLLSGNWNQIDYIHKDARLNRSRDKKNKHIQKMSKNIANKKIIKNLKKSTQHLEQRSPLLKAHQKILEAALIKNTASFDKLLAQKIQNMGDFVGDIHRQLVFDILNRLEKQLLK